MRLNDIIIVLARPSEPGNTGAVCRVMKNMGFSRLRLVNPEFDPFFGPEMEKLQARAVHAKDIWQKAEHFSSLKEALADCALSIGTSRRRGRRRKSITLTPRELADFLKPREGTIAIVFGNERTGLDREELELCNIASHIPVSPEFPSINLSHAAAMYCYELYQALAEPAPVPGSWVPMKSPEIDDLVKKTTDFLESRGFYKYPGREDQERFMRDIMARAGLNLHEGRYLCNIIAKSAIME